MHLVSGSCIGSNGLEATNNISGNIWAVFVIVLHFSHVSLP